jgi:hypothetical protein
MKAKTVFYATLGWVTFRLGKRMAKRKAREKLEA